MAKQKKVTVGEKEYTLQHPGAMWYLECMDRCKNKHGVLQVAKYSKELIENVVVAPQTTVSDFDDDIVGITQLVGEIESFLSSKD